MNQGRVLFSLGLLLPIVLATGCSKTPEQKLRGKWKGSPVVNEEMSRLMQESRMGQDVPDEAKDIQDQFAQTVGNIASRATMLMELHLNSGGQAVFKGHTEAFGLVGNEVRGSWEVVPKDSNRLFVKMGTKDHQVEGKVWWEDADRFYFQYEAPLNAKTELSGLFVEPVQPAADTEPATEGDDAKPAEPEKPKTKIVTMRFVRRITVD